MNIPLLYCFVFKRRRRDGDAGRGAPFFGGVPLLVPIGVLLMVPIGYDFWQCYLNNRISGGGVLLQMLLYSSFLLLLLTSTCAIAWPWWVGRMMRLNGIPSLE